MFISVTKVFHPLFSLCTTVFQIKTLFKFLFPYTKKVWQTLKLKAALLTFF